MAPALVFVLAIMLLWLVFSGRGKMVWDAMTAPAPARKAA